MAEGGTRIRVLPASVANVIAAGEVVERPASVVKELMENAVDAGADNVKVLVSDAGRTLINVIDNGCGMSPEEAVLSFERHATSKIAEAGDLSAISTFGFRGEALASIAAVAEVTLKTRMEGAEAGCEVHFADSKLVSTAETACPVGSNFAVRNLFYNVPGRRKFLKSDNVELKHIISEFTNVAITRPEVAFSLSHNGKDVFVLRKAMSLKFRIQDLLGAGAVNELIDISADIPEVRLSGFIGRPDFARKSLGNQFFFVNGRYFRSPYLHRAVMKGYENIVPEGYTPSYFIFLEVEPQKVDVNVSPRKTEVKFEDERVLFQVLQAYVREHLAKNSFSTGIDFDTEGDPGISRVGQYYYDLHSVTPPDAKIDHSYNPFNEEGDTGDDSGGSYGGSYGSSGGGQQSIFPGGLVGGSSPEGYQGDYGFDGGSQGGFGGDGSQNGYRGSPSWQRPRENYGKLFEDSVLPSKSIIVLHNKFIVTAVKSGLLVIDIRRARERILYGRFLKAITANTPHAQTVLFPVQVRVGAENLPLFEENSAILSATGFDIAPFGKDTVVVNGVPEGYSVDDGKVREMVSDLVEALSDDSSSVPGTVASVMAERFARIGAAGGSALTSTIEAQRLIDQLFASENADFTPSGHKTMTIIPAEDIEKKL